MSQTYGCPYRRRSGPGADLIIIEDPGHTGSTTMTSQIHAAADRLYQHITNPARDAPPNDLNTNPGGRARNEGPILPDRR
jgi:hypothetical protein